MHTHKLLSNIKPAQGKMHHKLVENAMTAGTHDLHFIHQIISLKW